VLEDISTNLALSNHALFQKSFFKENLAYQIFKIEDKLSRLVQIFNKTKVPAIIYVNSRKKTVEIANFLHANKFKSTCYHAGLSPSEKQIAFEDWMSEKKPIIVATNAFGMGIDKPNVGLVIHYNLPASIENYVQETGRAGRNEKKSFGVLFFNENDLFLQKKQVENSIPTISEIKEVHRKLYQYFRIANGELLEEMFFFNFSEFCEKYNFQQLKTDVILKLLANYGVVVLENSFHKKATLMVTGSHFAILHFSKSNSSLKYFVNILLRTYGGLFENEIKIDEFLIAKKAGITSSQVVTNLKILEKQNLVAYTQVTNDLSLRFLVPREDDKTINRFSKEIKQFLFLKKEKTTKFINFLTNNTRCRSEQLLSYFDEKTTKKCGICDVCISQKNKTKENITAQIQALLKKKQQLSSLEISSLLNISEKDILIHLQGLLATDQIIINNQNKFQIKE
jgi:ATP-dependent DNA helicase RecQ